MLIGVTSSSATIIQYNISPKFQWTTTSSFSSFGKPQISVGPSVHVWYLVWTLTTYSQIWTSDVSQSWHICLVNEVVHLEKCNVRSEKMWFSRRTHFETSNWILDTLSNNCKGFLNISKNILHKMMYPEKSHESCHTNWTVLESVD